MNGAVNVNNIFYCLEANKKYLILDRNCLQIGEKVTDFDKVYTIKSEPIPIKHMFAYEVEEKLSDTSPGQIFYQIKELKENKTMYIVIELFNFEYPTIVTDEEGKPKMFEYLLDAEKEASECQKGMVVPLEPHLINILKDIRGFINSYIVEEYGTIDNDRALLQQINNLLN